MEYTKTKPLRCSKFFDTLHKEIRIDHKHAVPAGRLPNYLVARAMEVSQNQRRVMHLSFIQKAIVLNSLPFSVWQMALRMGHIADILQN